MDKKSKILLGILFLLIIASVAVTYWRIMLQKDYVIENQIDCDPYAEKCFIWECDPTSTDEEEKCKGDIEEDIWYYQIAKRKAANIPLCDPEKDEKCDPWTCGEGEKDCSQTFCNDSNKAEQGVECNDPVKYTEENPIEEEGDSEESACAEGDEECLAAEEEAVDCDSEVEDCAEDEAVDQSDAGAADDAATPKAVANPITPKVVSPSASATKPELE
jgi:hypothetical protein